MEAKDTVIEGMQFLKIAHEGGLDAAALAQAKISFKAGEKQGMTDKIGVLHAEYRAGKKAGIKEVVEWLNTHKENSPFNDLAYFETDEWQVKLNEWGIK